MKSIYVLIFLAIIGSKFQNERLPPFEFTECIGGDKNEVGYWGDDYVYVIDMWGTSCKPCIENIPHLINLQNLYKDKKIKSHWV